MINHKGLQTMDNQHTGIDAITQNLISIYVHVQKTKLSQNNKQEDHVVLFAPLNTSPIHHFTRIDD